MFSPIRLVLCLFALSLPLASSWAEEASSFQGAAGAVAITPTEPIWMAGYASRDKPSAGQVHDIYAKVLLIEDAAGTRLAIVTMDLIGVTEELRAEVESHADRLGIPPASLLLNASHTHCAPELRSDRLVRYGIDAKYAALSQQYVRHVAAQIGKLLGETLARLEPVQLRYSHARAGFAMNRRLPTASGFINSPNPDGPVDHTVPVLQVVDAEQKLKAVLFGYACHNTTLSFDQICGDYAGFAQAYLQAAHPGTVALFMNGCSGDQNPYPRRTLELAEQHGRALANGVETALEAKSQRQLHGPLRVALENVTLEFATPPTAEQVEQELASSNRYARIHGQAMQEQLQRYGRIQAEYSHFPIQVVQLGSDLTLVALCGEVVVDYALRLKRELAGQTEQQPIVWVAGYSNHVFGYLPSLRVLQEGGYEGARAMQYTTYPGPFAESVEERVVAKVHQLVQQVRAK
ncbi:MAG: neutral/alkaline non-lysosomal ceramidase N-terminal domain-containing protein [Planctomycetales bacterium]|nr:neutral/alkaline non-lysosomal ceramidase N-terminal domain-containing protein [Planctomycetales bacterium]